MRNNREISRWLIGLFMSISMFSFSQKTSDMAYIQSHIVGDTNAVLNSIEKVKKEVFNGG